MAGKNQGKSSSHRFLLKPTVENSNIPRTSCGGNFCHNALRRKFPPHSRKSAANPKKTPQPKQKRRNTVCFPGISAAFPPISAAFPPISAANRRVEKTENKFCRNSKKTPQIRKTCRKSKKAPFLICGRNFCRNESLGILNQMEGVSQE